MSDQNQDLSMQDLQERIAALQQSIDQMKAMEAKQAQPDQALTDAQAQADKIIADANADADKIREDAKAEGRRGYEEAKDQAQSERDALRSEIEKLKTERQKMLDQLESEKPATAPVSAEPVPVTPVEAAPAPVEAATAPAVPAPAEPAAVAATAAALEAEAARLQAAAASRPAQIPAPAQAPAPATTQTGMISVPAKGDQKMISVPAGLPKRKHTGLKVFLWILFILALAAGVCFGFLFGIAKVNDEAMEEIAAKGDYVLYSRLDKDPDDGDVVMIKDRKGVRRVRFVAATSGETVDFDTMDGRLYVDDEVAVENFEPGADDTTNYPHTVKDAEVYVLCDNRDAVSQEGLFSTNNLKGRVLFVLRR